MLPRLSVAVLVLLLVSPVRGEAPPKADESLNLPNIAALMMAGGPMPGAEEVEFPKFEDVTKDMVSREGLFTLWSYPADAKNKDKEKLLAQIPRSLLGEKFMLSISYSGGGFFTGFPLDQHVVAWEELDRQLLLVEPDTGYVVDKSNPISDVIVRTHPDRIRKAIPILTKTPGGDPVIDLGPMLKSDFAGISWMSMGRGGMISPELSKWTRKKTFELNVELGVELAVARMFPQGSYEKRLLHYSFWKLPQTNYTPRIADDRVGYFLTTNQDWTKPSDSRDLFNRYIDRWNLVKRDPSLKLCEPVKPIVFYIEKTVPVKFRRAVRDGILEWNRAFEKIGFVDAIQVRQQTEDNEWKDLDPEDMRYSFFRWIVSGASFAMGPHRANPFTGEIYDADIIMDDSMVRSIELSAQYNLPSAVSSARMSDPALRDFLRSFPQFARPCRPWEERSIGEDDSQELREAMRERMRQRGHHCCEYAEGMKSELMFAGAMLAGQPREVIDKCLYDVIREIVMHEVGHTLGLRHNFIASSVYSLDEIKRRSKTGEATTGSVMDYNPTLFFREYDGNLAEMYFVTPTLGPYDFWAIEYGYRPADGTFESAKKDDEKPADDKKAEDKDAEADQEKSAAADEAAAAMAALSAQIPKDKLDKLPPEIRQAIESGAAAKMIRSGPGGPGRPARAAGGGSSGPMFKAANSAEEKMLLEIASRSAEPELAYATDEDTMFLSPDPRSNRFDLGADPVAWAEERLALIDKRMDGIRDWAVKDQESWYYLRNAFTSLLVQKAIVLDYVGRYIGGLYVSRAHRGDPDAPPPFRLVDAETQRKALAFIEKSLYSDEFFAIPPETLNHLAAARWWHDGVNISFTVDYPLLDIIGLLQWWNLFDRLFPNTLRRIHDAELKTDTSDRFTVAEYLQSLQRGCWAGTIDVDRAKKGKWTDAAPFVSSIRRSLQREYLGMMEPLVRIPPGMLYSPDLHAMVQHSLRTLAAEIEQVQETGKLDFASDAHLTACRTRIERMLKAELNEYGSGGGMMIGGF